MGIFKEKISPKIEFRAGKMTENMRNFNFEDSEGKPATVTAWMASEFDAFNLEFGGGKSLTLNPGFQSTLNAFVKAVEDVLMGEEERVVAYDGIGSRSPYEVVAHQGGVKISPLNFRTLDVDGTSLQVITRETFERLGGKGEAEWGAISTLTLSRDDAVQLLKVLLCSDMDDWSEIHNAEDLASSLENPTGPLCYLD